MDSLCFAIFSETLTKHSRLAYVKANLKTPRRVDVMRCSRKLVKVARDPVQSDLVFLFQSIAVFLFQRKAWCILKHLSETLSTHFHACSTISRSIAVSHYLFF